MAILYLNKGLGFFWLTSCICRVKAAHAGLKPKHVGAHMK